MKSVLLAVLCLSALMPIALGLVLVVSPDAGLARLGVEASPDTRLMGTFFAAGLLFAGGVQAQAAAWLAQGRPEGIRLALGVGVLLCLGGVVMLARLSNPVWGTVDSLKGLIVVGLAALVARARPAAEQGGAVRASG